MRQHWWVIGEEKWVLGGDLVVVVPGVMGSALIDEGGRDEWAGQDGGVKRGVASDIKLVAASS